MQFGLIDAPRTFIRLIIQVLKPLLGKFFVVYLDDILIFVKTKEEHLEHVRKELHVLISTEGLKMDPEKVKVILY